MSAWQQQQRVELGEVVLVAVVESLKEQIRLMESWEIRIVVAVVAFAVVSVVVEFL